ncbi:MAG TPA: UDP-N-acetylmuramoyl-L-alanine--D-glutamate ligase [Pelomicrobium sp.]|nr:UDP-N-acetylmuramoyl-L-alanine--D-glutamate ligase [Pelomicrobium sp.]
MDFDGRRVLVLGAGLTGLSAARWLARRGARVRVADSRAAPPMAERIAAEVPDAEILGGGFDALHFLEVDLMVISPGVPRSEPAVQAALARGVPLVGDVELFARALAEKQSGAKVLAITGSNGKSTVTALTGAMCREAGLATTVAGNIGLPVLDALDAEERAPEVYVLELSSFQLESTDSLAPDAAAMLNLSEDHLDRYRDLDDYAAAKARIFAGSGVQVLNRDDRRSLAMARPGRTVVTFGLDQPFRATDYGVAQGDGDWLVRGGDRLLPARELPLAGAHNAANALAAWGLAAAVGVDDAAAAAAARDFAGLPHRMQRVAEFDGVAFYNDSKGTNVGATVAALAGMPRPVVLIAGGEGKGQDFSPLAAPVCERARAVVLLGRDRRLIAQAIRGCNVPVHLVESMDEAVRTGFEAARPGDAVLLSPACASFDMFRNYGHRGEAFVEAVARLEAAR